MTERRKPIEPSTRAIRVAEVVIRDLCFTSYTRQDVMRVARRIAKEYESDGEAMRQERK